MKRIYRIPAYRIIPILYKYDHITMLFFGTGSWVLYLRRRLNTIQKKSSYQYRVDMYP